MEQQTGSKQEKEYVKAVYYHPTYLTSMQSSVQFSSVTQPCPTLCDPMNCSTPGLPEVQELPWSSLKLTSIESVMPPTHLILCRPLLLLPLIPPSIRVFSNDQLFA